MGKGDHVVAYFFEILIFDGTGGINAKEYICICGQKFVVKISPQLIDASLD
ncbi:MULTISPECIES: hypothetical protein [Photobacterium]|uniref:hypothetical protein n=1 Tax=Photobacterium TaxID=657 RepID=UPI0015E66ABE|nr:MULTISPECIES: hypothetical protein [Photobacterium]MCD9481474.1 hypothetical protein [Photobacterium phosphoreum]MCD9499352.1 hypothetical protein [Photobacterium carnosum]